MKEFRVKWVDLTEKAQKEYLKFFKVTEPTNDLNGDLVFKKD